ncbi:hypothetical protein E4U58_001245 [Claviceps cyperi]|nr:hypothetical protein E4U58_001245 [Claviceps cyperi]
MGRLQSTESRVFLGERNDLADGYNQAVGIRLQSDDIRWGRCDVSALRLWKRDREYLAIAQSISHFKQNDQD